MTDGQGQLHRREADFHDRWAVRTDLASVQVTAAFEATTAPENRFIVNAIGDLRGARVLDLGAGLGESSVYFALRGADVTMADLSPEMVALAADLGKHHGVRISTLVGAAETIEAPSSSFDVVYMANLLHHVTDRDQLFRTVRRVLKPGGRFFSWDPLAYNPVINVYRRVATAVRTPDESPLTFADLAVVFLTAKAMPGDREEAITAGATDYITKPVDLDELLDLIERTVTRRGEASA